MFFNKWKLISILILAFIFLFNLQPIITIADDEDDEHKYRSEWHEDDHEDYDDEEDKNHDENYDDNDDYENTTENNKNYVQLPSIDLTAFTWDRYQLPKDLTQSNTFYQQSLNLINPENAKTLQIDTLTNSLNNSIIYAPLKQTAQFLNAEILWHPKYEVIEVKTADKQLIFKINSAVIYENGKKLPMPAKTILFKDTVYVSAGVLIDGLGYTIKWNEPNQSSLIVERR